MDKEVSVWKVIYKGNNNNQWRILKTPSGFWCADPMAFKYNGKIYLFTEIFDMKKQLGEIAVSEYIGDTFTIPKVIIKTSYHMSYPCVFEYNEELYMLPETCQNGTLELWKAQNNDIFSWKKEKELLKGVKLVDSTVYIKEKAYIISYSEKEPWMTYVFEFNLDKMCVTELERVSTSENICRPAGYLFMENAALFRPVQNNISSYGESIIINEISSIVPFREEKVTEIQPSQLDNDKNRYSNTHTISKNGRVEVFDVKEKEQVSLRYRNVLIRKVRNKLYEIRYKLKYGNWPWHVF